MLIDFAIILEHLSIVLIWKTWILSERVHESVCYYAQNNIGNTLSVNSLSFSAYSAQPSERFLRPEWNSVWYRARLLLGTMQTSVEGFDDIWKGHGGLRAS